MKLSRIKPHNRFNYIIEMLAEIYNTRQGKVIKWRRRFENGKTTENQFKRSCEFDSGW